MMDFDREEKLQPGKSLDTVAFRISGGCLLAKATTGTALVDQ
jgi:hypothetical protein